MPLAKIGVILGHFAGTGKKTQCAGTEHTTPASSRDKQKMKVYGCKNRKYKIAKI